jgi:hypothetical protein
LRRLPGRCGLARAQARVRDHRDRLVACSRPPLILPVCETQLKQLDAAMAGRQPTAPAGPQRDHGSMLVHAIAGDPAAGQGCGR